MFCKTCEQFQENTSVSSFVTGCSNFRKENLSSHNVSQCHKLHAIAKHGRPFTDFKSLCELDKKKGLHIGETCVIDKKCAECISFVGSDEQKKLEESLKRLLHFYQYYVMIRQFVEGNVCVDFVAVRNVERPNATHIYECIVNVLEEYCGLRVVEIKVT
ncbi:hypothetical protein PR048_020489 [Dryococelus australis]|uniref:C17orf113 probable zinc finger domain-containing protein n=1 Tax=Dryococelus australis TaxID=614101 RepID=A0ABQ9H6F1_9NEOP|nr:hypothetical protein PR048_020489 [Dryococelus australis]